MYGWPWVTITSQVYTFGKHCTIMYINYAEKAAQLLSCMGALMHRLVLMNPDAPLACGDTSQFEEDHYLYTVKLYRKHQGKISFTL